MITANALRNTASDDAQPLDLHGEGDESPRRSSPHRRPFQQSLCSRRICSSPVRPVIVRLG